MRISNRKTCNDCERYGASRRSTVRATVSYHDATANPTPHAIATFDRSNSAGIGWCCGRTEGHDIRVLEMKLAITPDHQLIWLHDVFGNSVALVDFVESATELEVVSDVLVHRTARFRGRFCPRPAESSIQSCTIR